MRSTLACEAASSSVAFDRVSFLRAIIAELWGLKGPWYEKALHVPACLVTDCRSLHDHLLKTGGCVSDKRVALDLQDIRDGVDEGLSVVWQRTSRMAADGLTKKLAKQPALFSLLVGEGISLAPDDEDDEKQKT